MKFIAVDYQGDFGDPSGKWYMQRPSERFVLHDLLPSLRANGVKISEIISDYRLPRPSETLAYCVPGTSGYESLIPEDVKTGNTWIKCMNSPVWTRENAGIPDKAPGVPVSNPDLFTAWLREEIGNPEEGDDVVLFGLTLDCCVICLAQELYFRGYKASVLYEGVDTYLGTQDQKDHLFDTPLPMWAKKITWAEVQKKWKDGSLNSAPSIEQAA